MLRFLLNNESIAEDNLPADLTVLDYLRNHRHKCGTKEGCATGDCGACTVVVASVSDDRQSLEYLSINSCIAFMGAMQGKQLITVEDLQEGDLLHPVQQSLVDFHGSQCGFCTPGFVMSLFAMFKTPAVLDKKDVEGCRELINEHLAGNLCRCTGYRPIVDAALHVFKQPVPTDQFDRAEKATLETLLSLNNSASASGEFHNPLTLDELVSLRANFPDAKLLAGGTDLALEVTQKLQSIESFISIQSVAGFKQFIVTDEYLELGAGMSLTDCAGFLGGYYPDVKKLLHRFGSAQVRNLGTVGGNVANASPIGDLPPVFIALDASVILHSAENGDRELPIEAFFLDYRQTQLQPDEVLRAIRIPYKSGGKAAGNTLQQHLKIYKISKRLDDDISAVCAVFNLSMDGDVIDKAGVAFGGMAAISKRAISVENTLRGQPFSSDVIERAAAAIEADFQPISDMRASAQYRITVARNLLRRLSVDMTSPSTTTHVADYVD